MTALFAELPALPLHTAGKYVAAAYIVVLLTILIYVAIMAKRLITNQREIQKLYAELEAKDREAQAGAGLAGPAPAASLAADVSGDTEPVA